MKIKEAIEWIRNVPKINLYIGTKKEGKGKILFTNGIKDCTEEEYYKDINEVISLLQRGEKFEQMWNEIATMYKLPCYGLENQAFKDIVKYLEQKYFPKEARKTITIEFECQDRNVIKHHINILKADLERRKDCPKVKYNIKGWD